MFSNLFFYFFAVLETMWKNAVEPDRPHMILWDMRTACWRPKATNTHSENVYCFSTATMVAHMRLNVTLHAHRLFC
jgi:hypothetical protein